MEASNHRARHPLKTQQQIETMVKERTNGPTASHIAALPQELLVQRVRFNMATVKSGTHGACPSEMLHAPQLGIFRHCQGYFL